MFNKLKAFYDSVNNNETQNSLNEVSTPSVLQNAPSAPTNSKNDVTTGSQLKQTQLTTSKKRKEESKLDSYLTPISNFLSSSTATFTNERMPPLKYRYCRPQFLQLSTDDEIQVSADQSLRPIIVPRDINKLPWNSGYAEAVNAGKSPRNEDQATICKGLLRSIITPDDIINQVIDMMPTIPFTPNRTSFNNKINDLTSPSTPLPVEAIEANEFDIVQEKSKVILSSSSSNFEGSLPWQYFGLFDGHAGTGVAVAASNALHKIIQEKLQNIANLLIAFGLKNLKENKKENANGVNGQSEGKINEDDDEFVDLTTKFNETKLNTCKSEITSINGSLIVNHQKHVPKVDYLKVFQPSMTKLVTVDSLIIGALELSFWEMDLQIEMDKRKYRMSGGCTALVALFILGKLYVANAGDSRAIVHKNSQIIPMSFDFTPESERERIKYLGLIRPDYLGNDFTHLEYVRKPTRNDIGKKLLYRDAFMTGWAYKTITSDDLKVPLIFGEGKRSRVMVTIGVTRGFGDHELRVQNIDTYLKPFLTPQPEVKVMDLENDGNLTEDDVLIMGTDGLWDITSNERAASIVQKSLNHFSENDSVGFKYRYISAAQDLVMHARGKLNENGKGWKTSDKLPATIDDISVFVIPLKPYQQEFIKWKEAHMLVTKSS